MTLESGAILGIEQFLFNKQWEIDVFCQETAVVTKLKWDSLQDLVIQNALTASKLYKCAVRHFCYMQLYDNGKKAQNQHLFNFKSVEDDDLMIDFKLSSKSEKDAKLFSLISQVGAKASGQGEGRQEAGETMGFFLSDQFAAVIERQRGKDKLLAQQGDDQSTQIGTKSQFLQCKIEEQSEKRKQEKKRPAQPKKASEAAKRASATNDEHLLELIEELKTELSYRDQEY